MRSIPTVLFCLFTAATASVLFAQSEGVVTQPGAVEIEPPTTGAVGVEWRIQGDDNRNASAAAEWRRTGETAWRDGLPLLRLRGESVQQGASFHYVAPNMFAGSVFDLRAEHVVWSGGRYLASDAGQLMSSSSDDSLSGG